MSGAPFMAYVDHMSLPARLTAALEQAWDFQVAQKSFSVSLPEQIVAAVDDILGGDSAPTRQMLLTIAAATAATPESNSRSLQLAAGVDRRGQAKGLVYLLSRFRDDHGLTFKMSNDPGVSNPWREPQIDASWVEGRRGQSLTWASGFLVITDWLEMASSVDEKSDNAQELLEFVSFRIVEQAVGNSLNYPVFPVTPRVALELVDEFLAAAPNVPDATEAVVTAAARTLCAVIDLKNEVIRGDTNSPDAIDILIKSQRAELDSGIEVTDEFISLAKLQHEVLPAMLKHGLGRATVVSRGVKSAERDEISRWLRKVFVTTGQRIDLATVGDIETWLSFPGTPDTLATEFLRETSRELDAFSGSPNRRAWYDTLTAFVAEITETN
jgi:hypothetical protein